MRPSFAERIQAMSPEDLAGQLLVLGFEGTVADAAARTLALRPAGLSLLPRNLTDAAQTARLAGDLQRAVSALGGDPLLLAADQEGGSITAVAEGTTVFPGAMALGAAGATGLTGRAARAQGLEAQAMGINLNYAPVADLNLDPDNPIIGVRSFGDDPAASPDTSRRPYMAIRRPGSWPRSSTSPATGRRKPTAIWICQGLLRALRWNRCAPAMYGSRRPPPNAPSPWSRTTASSLCRGAADEGSWWSGRCTLHGRGSGIQPPPARWVRRSGVMTRGRRSILRSASREEW